MRIKRERLKQIYHRKAVSKKDKEGNSYLEYETATTAMAEIWPAGGKIQAEIYGQRLAYIRNCRIDGKYAVVGMPDGKVFYSLEDGKDVIEGDGICLNVSSDAEPDYRIISIKPYRYLTMEVEKIR